jgi:hypothetical protein
MVRRSLGQRTWFAVLWLGRIFPTGPIAPAGGCLRLPHQFPEFPRDRNACGTRHVGTEAVRKAFAAAWQAVPDAQWINGRHFVHGDFGTSQWTFTGTAADGSRIETDGIDVFTFRGGKIHLKNVFRKARPNLPAAR